MNKPSSSPSSFSSAGFFLGGHRGFGCTDHNFYQDKRAIAALPVENTLDSITAAFRHGADYVEIDAVMSADGVVFPLHNVIPSDHFFGPDIPSAPLNLLPFSAISRYKTGRCQNGTLTPLSDILTSVAHMDPRTAPWAINIEIKGVLDSSQPYDGPDFIDTLARIVQESPLADTRILYSSFCLESLLAMSHRMPQARFAMIFAEHGMTDPLYSDHQDDPRYRYCPFTQEMLEHVLQQWSQHAHPQSRLDYLHPEILTVTEDMIRYVALHRKSLNSWAYRETPEAPFTTAYREAMALCHRASVPLNLLTDYIPDIQKLFGLALR